jgi:hypothetical protein
VNCGCDVKHYGNHADGCPLWDGKVSPVELAERSPLLEWALDQIAGLTAENDALTAEIVRLRDALRQVDRLTGEDMSSGEIVSAIIRTTEILNLGEA